jgi:hypothetical protein
LGLVALLATCACAPETATGPSVRSLKPSTSAPPSPGQSVVTWSAADIAVKAQYARLFQQDVEVPAVFSDPVRTLCAVGHLTSTLYRRSADGTSALYYLYASADGQQVATAVGPTRVITPAGHFKVLLAVVNWSATVTDNALPLLEAAEARINQDHIDFATSQGFAAPIVTFETTNVLLSPGAGLIPRYEDSVRSAVVRLGFDPTAFDFLAVLNLDPTKLEGGFSLVGPMHPAFIYMGNYWPWTGPLTAADYVNVASAIYHHEVAHHWGWPADHGWPGDCGHTTPPFLVAPVLFGWTDLDLDHVPEILDDTPYGGGPLARHLGTTAVRRRPTPRP